MATDPCASYAACCDRDQVCVCVCVCVCGTNRFEVGHKAPFWIHALVSLF